MLPAPLPRNRFPDRSNRVVEDRDPDAPRPAAHWVDHAFPPGYNAATRGVIREASLAPFRRALAQRVADLRRLIPTVQASEATREGRLATVRHIEQQGKVATARGLVGLCRRLNDLRDRLQA